MFAIRLFGDPSFTLDEQPFRLRAPEHGLRLLAHLSLHQNGALQRKAVAHSLWPDDGEHAAHAKLRRHLHGLMKALPPAIGGQPWIIADEATIRWNADADFRLDVSEFERLSLYPEHRLSAIALYRGDLLERLPDEWLFAPRERLRDLYLADLLAVLRRARENRDFPQALKAAHLLLNADPWREDVLRQTMELRYVTGDRAGALYEYEQFANRLREEMSVAVMPETAALRDLIARNEQVADRQNAPQSAIVWTDISILPLVGRDRELEHLKLLLSRTSRGTGTTLFIAGEAGVGKTRLCIEASHIASSQGARVLVGGTSLPEASPYQSLSEALRPAIPEIIASQIEPIWLTAVVPLLPDLAVARPDLPRLAVLDPQRERIRLFEALARICETLAAKQPLILALEDLHWTGSATAAALEFLARRAATQSILLIATYRDEELSAGHALRAIRNRLLREQRATHLSPARLSAGAVERLIGLIPGISRRTELAASVFELSEGNPLFVAQVIRDYMESAGANNPSSPWIAPELANVKAAIGARLDRLSPDATTALNIAAVAGTAFDTDLVSGMMRWPDARVLDAIGELTDRNLIREGTSHNRFDYVFSHHLIQEAAYARIAEAEKVRRHHRIAHLLERRVEQPDELAGQLAFHYDRGGDRARASHWYLAAARNAFALYANEEALKHTSRALELAGTRDKRIEALKLRESINARVGDRATQRADIEELGRLADEADDDELRSEALFREVMLHRALGERRREIETITELADLAEHNSDRAWQLRAEMARAGYEIGMGSYKQAAKRLRELREVRKQLGDEQGQVECLCLLAEMAHHREDVVELQHIIEQAQAFDLTGVNRALFARLCEAGARAALMNASFDQCSKLTQQWLAECVAIGDRQGEAAAHRFLVGAKANEGQFAVAREHFRLAAALYARIEDPDGYAALVYNNGLFWCRLGRFEEAEQQFVRATELFEVLGSLRGLAQSYSSLGATKFYLRKFQEATVISSRALELARNMNSSYLESLSHADLARELLALGAVDTATEHALDAVVVSRRHGRTTLLAVHLLVLAECRLAAGDRDAAASAARESYALVRFAISIDISDFQQEVLWRLAQVLHELNMSEQSSELLLAAHRCIEQRLAEIPDQETRESYQAISFNRDARQAFERGVWARPPYLSLRELVRRP